MINVYVHKLKWNESDAQGHGARSKVIRIKQMVMSQKTDKPTAAISGRPTSCYRITQYGLFDETTLI